MSTLAFSLDAIDEFYDQKSRAEVAAEAEEPDEESDEESDIVETPAYDEELDLSQVVDA